ncbi:pyruvate:ferredoxin (flavodoxin) oxidoreductase [Candidatus Woesearchaeota archaeon]|nr:pyruvate:ferredoxin (flavodoxin) oxidoreductase [Candidatus Woesearchaeota archaeon]
MTKHSTIDGNTAASTIAYAFSEVAAIYPITPSSNMGELADENAAKGKLNLFGQPVEVIEMQSEGGASGAVHGALSAGALTTTFTSSQGLMLMLPNMHKIAGEMLPTVFHVAARSLACQALSIFADHSDVMAARNTGFAIMAAADVQETQDLAVISHWATVKARIPFLNFFDGFRTSHQVEKITVVDEDTMRAGLDEQAIKEFKARALNPEHPVCKVGAENPDVYFQGRETVNKYYQACPGIVKKCMLLFGEKTGRHYQPFDYVGSPDAEKVIIAMGSANNTLHEVVDYLNARGDNVGAIKVRLYRPFSVEDFLAALPKNVKKIAVLDRTKEPGSIGEPLYLDVIAALKGKDVTIIGGRYGLSSKEFTPTMAKSVYDHLDNECFHGFTVGINDDVTHTNTKILEEIDSEPQDDIKCKFWGYGSDGTVSANKNSIKIIGESTDQYVQAYFSYDSHKAGGVTVSHLRFGKHPIRSQYFLTKTNFVALHKTSYIGRYDILEGITEGGTFLLNSPWQPGEAFNNLTEDMQRTIKEKNLKCYTIDANKIAADVGLGNRINTVMQAAFFKISGVLPEEEALQLMKEAVKKQFSSKGEKIVQMNYDAIDRAREALQEVVIPEQPSGATPPHQHVPPEAGEWEKGVIEPIMRLKGDDVPVSKMPLDGSVPTGTNKLEKRGIALTIPKWLPEKCTQCGICAMVCPHASIRTKQIDPKSLEGAPEGFTTLESNTKNDRGLRFRVQVYPQDCTGTNACGNCVDLCPVGALVQQPLEEAMASGEAERAAYFDSLPDITDGTRTNTIKGSQLITPLFEFSGACAGCGETPYLKLVTQLFGDRMIIANATGCSSIYGGTFPITPYAKNKEGRGPAWANSLFEDNAEYGFGFRLAVDANRRELKATLERLLKTGTTEELRGAIERMLGAWEKTDDEAKQAAKDVLAHLPKAKEESYGESAQLLSKADELKDFLVDKSVWAIGGDGWAYDIGYGGLDHVMASGRNVNVLVLDTEVYSNTGGQCSKATPRGATAKFAVSGKKQSRKDLGRMLMTYGNVYVATVSLGANMNQVIKAMTEAESYDGPSIIIAYSPCIAHHIDMRHSNKEYKLAVESGYWPLYRYDPRLRSEGKNPFQLDSHEPKVPFTDYLNNEGRYKSLKIAFPEEAERLFKLAEQDAQWRLQELKALKDTEK